MKNSITDFWNRTMEIPEARWIVWITVLVIAVLIAVYVAVYFRKLAFGNEDSSSDHLSEFRRLKDEGKLDAKEYAKLKTTIRHQDSEPSREPSQKKNMETDPS